MSDKNNKTLKPGWRRVKFGDVVRLSKARSQDPLADGIERYVGLEHLAPGDLRIRSWGSVADGVTFTSVFQPGQVLFGKRRAYQRKVAVADFSGVCSGDIYVLETKDAKVLLPELLPFICQTNAFFDHAVGTSAGSLSPRTNWTSLADFEFSLPSVEDQRAILELLKAAEACAIAYEEAKHSHEQLLASFIQESFSSFDEQYEHRPCKDLMDKITVGIVVKPADLYVAAGRGVRALRSLNVLPGRFVLDEVVEISVEGHAAHQKSALSAGDIVIVRTGRPGDAAVVTPELADTNCIDLILAKPGPSISADYVVAFLNSQFGRRIFSSGTTGTAQQHFNVGEFSKLKLATEGKAYHYGSIGLPVKDWGPWHLDGDGDDGQHHPLKSLKLSAESMLRPHVVLDILGSFTLFATNKKKQRIKVICRYQQFEAANKIVERVLAGYPRKGLIWHFQGSGKSLLMVFAAQKLRMHAGLKNPTVLIVVDRIDLDSQITGTFTGADIPNLEKADSPLGIPRPPSAGCAHAF